MASRYLPQIRIGEIGEEGQRRLLGSSVLIVGCGALGSALAMYLSAAGVGHIFLCDFDTIELSNLHRQVFYKESETGMSKARILAQRIAELNSEVQVTVIEELVRRPLLNNLKDKFSLIADCADNPSTTYLLDSFCVENEVILSTAGISGWKAQIFTYCPSGGSLSYGDIFPRPSEGTGVLPCSVAGITGATAAFAASLQCAEIIKSLIGLETESSRLVTANLLSDQFKTFC